MTPKKIKAEINSLNEIYARLCNPHCHIDLSNMAPEILAKKKEEVYHQLAFLQHMLKYSK